MWLIKAAPIFAGCAILDCASPFFCWLLLLLFFLLLLSGIVLLFSTTEFPNAGFYFVDEAKMIVVAHNGPAGCGELPFDGAAHHGGAQIA